MNAVSHPVPNLVQEYDGGSDSDDLDPDESRQYYQPISSTGGDDYEEQQLSDDNSDNDDSSLRRLPNGYPHRDQVENGLPSLDLSDEESSEEEEEERMREASDRAMRRAFREDESRRNAPLPRENAVRVMEAMRGISFGGIAPDWAGRVPEDQWIDRLTRLRRPPPGSLTNAATAIQH